VRMLICLFDIFIALAQRHDNHLHHTMNRRREGGPAKCEMVFCGSSSLPLGRDWRPVRPFQESAGEAIAWRFPVSSCQAHQKARVKRAGIVAARSHPHSSKIALTSFRGVCCASRSEQQFLAAAQGARKLRSVRRWSGFSGLGFQSRSMIFESGHRVCSVLKQDSFTIYAAVLPWMHCEELAH